jgi:hypothetical protein
VIQEVSSSRPPGTAGVLAGIIKTVGRRPGDPALAGDQVPFVEKRLEPLVPELAGEVLHGRLVGAGVAEEDVVAGHAISLLGSPTILQKGAQEERGAFS